MYGSSRVIRTFRLILRAYRKSDLSSMRRATTLDLICQEICTTDVRTEIGIIRPLLSALSPYDLIRSDLFHAKRNGTSAAATANNTDAAPALARRSIDPAAPDEVASVEFDAVSLLPFTVATGSADGVGVAKLGVLTGTPVAGGASPATVMAVPTAVGLRLAATEMDAAIAERFICSSQGSASTEMTVQTWVPPPR